jgi:hypothetical protein
MQNDVYKRWKSFGFLEGLTEEDGVALAERYEELGNHMLQNSDKLDEHVQTLAFPVLRRAFMRGLNEKYSPRALCEKIKKEYDQEVRKIKEKSMTNIDAEAEYAVIISEYFSRNKN